jgi:hypothetical protein
MAHLWVCPPMVNPINAPDIRHEIDAYLLPVLLYLKTKILMLLVGFFIFLAYWFSFRFSSYLLVILSFQN